MNDPFVQQLLIAIESALSDIKVDYDIQWDVWQVVCGAQVKLIPAVFEHVFSELTTELAVLMEQQILGCEFNQVYTT